MRQLTKNEIVNKPHWAKSYAIHAQSDEPIFYAHLGYGATPIPCEEFEAQQQEIAELKSIAAYAEQRANMLQKANDALVLKNASLNSQAVNQVAMYNEQIDEVAELKSNLQSVKADAVKEAALKLADDLLISPHAQREMMEYAIELGRES